MEEISINLRIKIGKPEKLGKKTLMNMADPGIHEAMKALKSVLARHDPEITAHAVGWAYDGMEKPIVSLDETELRTYCLICTEPIPADRQARKSNTCREAHSKLLSKLRRAVVNQRRCSHCYRPANPEEKALFKLWHKTLPKPQAKKRGPRKKEAQGERGISVAAP